MNKLDELKRLMAERDSAAPWDKEDLTWRIRRAADYALPSLIAVAEAVTPQDAKVVASIFVDYQERMREKGDKFGEEHWHKAATRFLALAAALAPLLKEVGR